MRARRIGPLVLFGSLVSCGGDFQGGATPPDAFPEGASGDASDGAARDASAPSHACAEAGEASGGTTPLPLGLYTQCVASVVDSNLTAAGDATGALTLTESDGVLSVALGDGLFSISPGTLAFNALTSGAAVVAPGQSYGLLVVSCPTATAAAGALALDGNSLVVSILGQGCGSRVGGFIECPLPAQPTGALEGPDLCDDGDAGPQNFPVGTYAQCTGSIPGYGEGSVTLSESGGVWTAALAGVTGVSTLESSLALSPSSSSAALVAPGQMLSVQEFGWGPSCSGPPPNDSGLVDDPGPVTRTMTTDSGWLVVDGSTLFVFLGGTDECGTAVHESFNCIAQ
jgi:hypothetical protein